MIKLDLSDEDIINGDETAIYFFPDMKRSLTIKGERRTMIQNVDPAGSRATFHFAVDATGRFRKTSAIFKGEPNATLAKKARGPKSPYPKNVSVYFNRRAWMNGELMATVLRDDVYVNLHQYLSVHD